MPCLPFVYGYIRHLAHVLTVPPTKVCLLCATLAGMDLYIYTGPCPKALTECSPLDFRRSSICARNTERKYNNKDLRPESYEDVPLVEFM